MSKLIITRRQGDRVMIGDNIILRIMEVKGKLVKLEWFAPPSVIIDREEKLTIPQIEAIEAATRQGDITAHRAQDDLNNVPYE
jgi:carbon storage regulator